MATKETTNTSLVKRLFEVGGHFGFSKSRRHPSVAPYLFGTKQGTDIFDLEKTSALVEDAAAYIRDIGARGKRVLFVGTKPEIADIVRTTAEGVSMPYVTNRWIGGILTNYPEIKKRLDRMAGVEAERASGELDRKYTKKERLIIDREVEKLKFNFSGIVSMDGLPGAVVIVDPRHEVIAATEARQMNIPTIALLSSDCDLNMVTKPVVVNDSTRTSVTFVLGELAHAYAEGRASFVPKQDQARAQGGTAH